MRAVIFDLWDTLVKWPVDDGAHLRMQIARLMSLPDDEFERRWRETYRVSQTGPLVEAYRALGLPAEHVEAQIEARHAFGRRSLRPRTGAPRVLAELRRRRVKTAVLSNCSEEVPAAWPACELSGLFDAETFSSVAGLMKPDPEIYLHTARALGVSPAECLFVGDGANDELAGAERVGMTSVLFMADGALPPWPEVSDWQGLRITAIDEVLELC
jgi:putative hydrolase of the HAD superfamily